jgi:PTS system nitrogen regulatory IIA component
MHEIMTIEEVASYLRVSERTVYEWAQKGDLPGGKIGTTWRFKSADIEKWVNDRLKGQGAAVDEHAVSSVLTPERVFLLPEGNKAGVLGQLIDSLSRAPEVRNASVLRSGMLERERLMSTGIGFGVGVPHVRSDAVSDLIMAVAVCKKGIEDYDSLDGMPVTIVCMLAARADQHTEYLRTLSSISSRLKDAPVRKELLGLKDASAVVALLMD